MQPEPDLDDVLTHGAASFDHRITRSGEDRLALAIAASARWRQNGESDGSPFASAREL